LIDKIDMYSAQLRFARNQSLWPAGKSGPNCEGVHRRILKLENFLTKSGKSKEKLEEERWGVPALKNGGSRNNRNTLHRSIHISMN